MKQLFLNAFHNTQSSLIGTYRGTVAYARKYPFRALLFALASTLVLTPIIYLFVLLVTSSVNIPFWDQWVYVGLIDKWRHGTLTIGDLWRQHNEHRIFVPELFQVLLSSVTGWNIRIEIMMNFVLGLGSFTILTALLRRTFRGRIAPLMIAMVISAWLFFSPVQYINWVWGFQLAWFMSVLAIVATVWALTKYQTKNGFDRWFIIAIITALIATFSLANGMLVWVMGIGLLMYKRVPRNQYIAWSATGVAAIGLYFYHLVRPEEPSPFWLLLHRTRDLTEYTLQYLGRNVAFTPSSAKDSGIVLLILLAASIVLLYRKKRLGAVAPWLALAFYGGATALLAAFSRMYTFGVDHSMGHSYTTISVQFVIGTLVTVIYTATVYLEKAPARLLRGYLVVAFALGIIAFPFGGNFWYNYTDGARELRALGVHMSGIRHCVFTVTSANDPCLDIVYPGRETAWYYVTTLKNLNWDHLKDDTRNLPQHN